MSFANDTYGKRTLDFVTEASCATTARDIEKLTITELSRYGLEFITNWSFPSVDQDFSDTILFNTRPQSYIDHYIASQLVTKDPIVAALRQTISCLSWSDVRERRLSKKERFIIEEGRDFGATDGLTVPVLSDKGWVGVFSPCGRDPDLSPRARAALEVVGIYAHQALQRLSSRHARNAKSHVSLTPREREVMRWVALGKTNDEIAIILRVARPTVKTILARAQSKLNASGRTYAVVQALRLGELDMNF